MLYATKIGLPFLLCVISCFAQTASQDRAVSGVVLGPDGNPLANVQVTGNHHNAGGGYEAVSTRTSSTGQFLLESAGPVIFFRADGFNPATHVLKTDEPLTVTLQPERTATWHLKSCAPLPPHVKAVKAVGRITIPKGLKVKRSVGVDTWDDTISYNGDRSQRLNIWLGPGNYDPQPLFGEFVQETWITDAKEITERQISFGGKVFGIDVSGLNRSGHRWRWIAAQAGITYYYDVSDEAAAFFDSILETACVSPVSSGAPKAALHRTF